MMSNQNPQSGDIRHSQIPCGLPEPPPPPPLGLNIDTCIIAFSIYYDFSSLQF